MTLFDDFTAAVRDAIARKTPMPERLALLRDFRDRGLTATAAADALKTMCVGTEQDIEDQLHDLLDIATGWCSSSWLVWPTGKPTESS